MRLVLLSFVMGAMLASCTASPPSKPPVTVIEDDLPPAAPARPQLPESLSRLLFPKDPPQLVDALEYTNRAINQSIVYQTDMEQYGETEKWVAMPESGRGDCEDYALTKLMVLQKAGFPIVQRSRITLLVVKTGDTYTGHAVLEILLPSGAIAVMDNNFNSLMTRKDLEANYGYKFLDW